MLWVPGIHLRNGLSTAQLELGFFFLFFFQYFFHIWWFFEVSQCSTLKWSSDMGNILGGKLMNPCSTCAQPIYISQWHFQNSGPISIIWNQVHTAYNTKNSEKNIACLVEMRFGYLILRCLPNCDILRIFKSESLYIAPNGVKSKPRLHKKICQNIPTYISEIFSISEFQKCGVQPSDG